MRSSSSLVADGDKHEVDDRKGCSVVKFVGVFKSISAGFDCGDVNNDVDDGRSEVDMSPLAESGKLLVYCKRKTEKDNYYLFD